MSKSSTIKFEGSDKDLEYLEELKINVNKLASQAFAEYMDWLRANRRPSTISEIEVERLYSIFKEAPDVELSEDFLIRRFRFPVGRVRYLLSAIRKRYPDVMSRLLDKATDQLKKAVADQKRIRFPIPDDIAYLLRLIAKQNGWDLKAFTLSRLGYGRFMVDIDEGLKQKLQSELEAIKEE